MFAASKTKGVSAVAANYIEDVFSTYLYTGNGSTQTITNGIDLSTYGGLVWSKSRSTATNNWLYDTARGANNVLISNDTLAQTSGYNAVSAFNANGFTVGNSGSVNTTTYASWTFRKQPKFFDVVTYTGDGVAGRQIAHSLGSVPGCIIIKRYESGAPATSWLVYHTSVGNTSVLQLNTTGAPIASSIYWNNTSPTSTVFSVGTSSAVNASGGTYVAYLFAHNAGGFGLTGTDNVISCGSFTLSGGAANVTLGWEPQYLLLKRTDAAEAWFTVDTMRGWTTAPGTFQYLMPNASNAEAAGSNWSPNATGFALTSAGSGTYIYIAIRRGPMKVPTDGTKVYQGATYTGNATTRTISTSPETPDFAIVKARGSATYTDPYTSTRLCGSQMYMSTASTAAEANGGGGWINMDLMNGFQMSGSSGGGNASGVSYVTWPFARAPSVFDVVCYTGTGVARTVTHNLGVVPEFMIVKNRSTAGPNWQSYVESLGATQILQINTTNAASASSLIWNNTPPTSSNFTVGTAQAVNGNGENYVAYLFATCPGVSKVGSYTGNGSTQTINCGFTGGARFVLIKRTDSTGNWTVLDTARGMVAGTDPYLQLNTTNAEVNANNVYTTTGGFQLVSSYADTNANGGTYIFLAIA